MTEEIVDAYAAHVKALREKRQVEAEIEVTPTFNEEEAELLVALIQETYKQFKPHVQAPLVRAQGELLDTLTAAREGWKAQRDR